MRNRDGTRKWLPGVELTIGGFVRTSLLQSRKEPAVTEQDLVEQVLIDDGQDDPDRNFGTVVRQIVASAVGALADRRPRGS